MSFVRATRRNYYDFSNGTRRVLPNVAPIHVSLRGSVRRQLTDDERRANRERTEQRREANRLRSLEEAAGRSIAAAVWQRLAGFFAAVMAAARDAIITPATSSR